MEERFKYIHFKSEFFYNLLILNPSNYIKLIKIQITVNVSSKRRLGQDPTKYQGRLKVISDDLDILLGLDPTSLAGNRLWTLMKGSVKCSHL